MARPKPHRPSLRQGIFRLKERYRKLQLQSLPARVILEPQLRTITARQEAELGRLPAKTRAALKRKGFKTRPILSVDYRAIKFRGTEIPIGRGFRVKTGPQQLGKRTFQETLRHEIGHQVLWLHKVPTRLHEDLLK